PHLCVVLFPGRGFDATGHVHAKWVYAPHGSTDVFGSQAPREKNRATQFLRFESKVPIKAFAGPAWFTRRVSVQQPGVGFVSRQGIERPSVANAKRFDGHQTKSQAILR